MCTRPGSGRDKETRVYMHYDTKEMNQATRAEALANYKSGLYDSTGSAAGA
jgi:hypothetical protein